MNSRLIFAFVSAFIFAAIMMSSINIFFEGSEKGFAIFLIGVFIYLPFSIFFTSLIGIPIYLIHKKYQKRFPIVYAIFLSGILANLISIILFQEMDIKTAFIFSIVGFLTATVFAHNARLMPYNKTINEAAKAADGL